MAVAKPHSDAACRDQEWNSLQFQEQGRDIHGKMLSKSSADLKFSWKYSCWVRQGVVGAAGPKRPS